jgi:hypothetical protein
MMIPDWFPFPKRFSRQKTYAHSPWISVGVSCRRGVSRIIMWTRTIICARCVYG